MRLTSQYGATKKRLLHGLLKRPPHPCQSSDDSNRHFEMKSPLRSEEAAESSNQTTVVDGLRAIVTEEQPW